MLISVLVNLKMKHQIRKDKEDEILKKAKEDLEDDPGIRDIKNIFSGASFDSDSVKLKNEKYLGEEMKGGIGQLKKQAQQMQEKMQKAQEGFKI